MIKGKKKITEVSSETLCQSVVKGMQERKGLEIVVLDLRNVKSAITDYFVICSGTSDTQIDALADSVEEEVWKDIQANPWKRCADPLSDYPVSIPALSVSVHDPNHRNSERSPGS